MDHLYKCCKTPIPTPCCQSRPRHRFSDAFGQYRHKGDAFTCPANPWTRMAVQLDEPLGDRELVAGPEKPD